MTLIMTNCHRNCGKDFTVPVTDDQHTFLGVDNGKTRRRTIIRDEYWRCPYCGEQYFHGGTMPVVQLNMDNDDGWALRKCPKCNKETPPMPTCQHCGFMI